MKKLIFLCLAAICSTGIFGAPLSNASERILKLFHHDFPEVQNQSFFDYGDSYMVYFKNEDNSSCKVYYSLDGTVSETIRYYSASGLSPFLRAKLNAKYNGKKIFGITEVESDSEHYYQIILEDYKFWYTIHSDDMGSMFIEKKLIKS